MAGHRALSRSEARFLRAVSIGVAVVAVAAVTSGHGSPRVVSLPTWAVDAVATSCTRTDVTGDVTLRTGDGGALSDGHTVVYTLHRADGSQVRIEGVEDDDQHGAAVQVSCGGSTWP